MNPATDVRHLPPGNRRAIGVLILALAVTGAAQAAAREAAPPVALGQTMALDGGSKDVAALDRRLANCGDTPYEADARRPGPRPDRPQ